MCKVKSYLLILMVICCSVGLAFGAAYTVGESKDYQTIQSAIDSASDGDSIVVYPGTYYENVYFNGKDIVVGSVDPNSSDIIESTIICGNGIDPTVSFDGSETSSAELIGFTITTDPNTIGDDPNLIGYWPLDGDPNDVNHIYTCVINGDPNWLDGPVDTCVIFDGVDDYIEVSDDDSLDLAEGLTASLWIKPEADSSNGQTDGQLLTKGTCWQPDSFAFAVHDNSANRLRMRYNLGGVNYQTGVHTDVNYWDGHWHHVVFTIESGFQKIYFDGVEVGSASNVGFLATSDEPLLIGTCSSYNRYYEGAIDDVRFYDRALSADEVAEIARNGNHWSVPVQLEELNSTSYDITAAHPNLSSDGLRMYYSAYDPNLGYNCLFEAERSSVCDPFSSVTRIDEFGGGVGAPTIANDLSGSNPRVYFHRDGIKMSEYDPSTDTWSTPALVFSASDTQNYRNMASASLTEDEKTIVLHTGKAESGFGWTDGDRDLMIATRATVTEPNGAPTLFGEPVYLSSINTQCPSAYEFGWDYCEYNPHIMPDGLTIYFTSNRQGFYSIYKATRLSTSEDFGNVELVEFPFYYNYGAGGPFVTSDERVLYFGTPDGIWETHLHYGGGILGNGTTATIESCIVEGNQAYNGGGIAECDGCIDNCVIRDNVAENQGGGLYACNGTITDTIIIDNEAEIECTIYSCGDATIVDSLVTATSYDDSDLDMMPDYWEYVTGLNYEVYNEPDDDADSDGLTDYSEYLSGTYPLNAYSFANGILDSVMVNSYGIRCFETIYDSYGNPHQAPVPCEYEDSDDDDIPDIVDPYPSIPAPNPIYVRINSIGCPQWPETYRDGTDDEFDKVMVDIDYSISTDGTYDEVYINGTPVENGETEIGLYQGVRNVVVKAVNSTTGMVGSASRAVSIFHNKILEPAEGADIEGRYAYVKVFCDKDSVLDRVYVNGTEGVGVNGEIITEYNDDGEIQNMASFGYLRMFWVKLTNVTEATGYENLIQVDFEDSCANDPNVTVDFYWDGIPASYNPGDDADGDRVSNGCDLFPFIPPIFSDFDCDGCGELPITLDTSNVSSFAHDPVEGDCSISNGIMVDGNCWAYYDGKRILDRSEQTSGVWESNRRIPVKGTIYPETDIAYSNTHTNCGQAGCSYSYKYRDKLSLSKVTSDCCTHWNAFARNAKLFPWKNLVQTISRNHYIDKEITLFIEPPLIESESFGYNVAVHPLRYVNQFRPGYTVEYDTPYGTSRGPGTATYYDYDGCLWRALAFDSTGDNYYVDKKVSVNGECLFHLLPLPSLGYGSPWDNSSIFATHSKFTSAGYCINNNDRNKWYGELDIVPQGYVVGDGKYDVHLYNGATTNVRSDLDHLKALKGPNKRCNGMAIYNSGYRVYVPSWTAVQFVYEWFNTYSDINAMFNLLGLRSSGDERTTLNAYVPYAGVTYPRTKGKTKYEDDPVKVVTYLVDLGVNSNNASEYDNITISKPFGVYGIYAHGLRMLDDDIEDIMYPGKTITVGSTADLLLSLADVYEPEDSSDPDIYVQDGDAELVFTYNDTDMHILAQNSTVISSGEKVSVSDLSSSWPDNDVSTISLKIEGVNAVDNQTIKVEAWPFDNYWDTSVRGLSCEDEVIVSIVPAAAGS